MRLMGRLGLNIDPSSDMKCSLQKVREDRYTLAGSVETLPFELVVQALGAAWGTGVLLADCGVQVGKVYFENGLIVSVQVGPLRNQEAFNHIYRRVRRFLFQNGKGPAEREMEGSIQQHLLAAAQSVDESAA